MQNSGTAGDDPRHIALLLRAARMYYEEGLSQGQIARRIGWSRPTVSRILSEARDCGVVRVSVGWPGAHHPEEYESALMYRFGLREAKVIPSAADPGHPLIDRLGLCAGLHLDHRVREGCSVGVSNGRSIAALARRLRPLRSLSLTVVQMIGALRARNPLIDGPDIARALAAAYRGRCRYLHAPLLAPDPLARRTLAAGRGLSLALALARSVDIALVGIGSLDAPESSQLFDGYLGDAERAALRERGAVGHLVGTHFDSSGRPLDDPVNDRVIAIGLDDLRRIPEVVAVAGGADKAVALLGALRGGYVDTLLVDSALASRLLVLATHEGETQRRPDIR